MLSSLEQSAEAGDGGGEGGPSDVEVVDTLQPVCQVFLDDTLSGLFGGGGGGGKEVREPQTWCIIYIHMYVYIKSSSYSI